MTTAAQIKKLQEERTNKGIGGKLEEDVIRQQHREAEEEARIAADNRVQVKRLLRNQRIMDHEKEMQESLLRIERDRLVKEQLADQEEKLANELERRHLEEMRLEKARQHIRENSEELRELESKLKAAYTNKERAAQIAHKKAMLAREEGKDSEMARLMQEANERAAQEERECEERRLQDKLRYQQELERQLEEQEITKQQAFQQSLKDKLMVDEIVRKIYEEDQKELEKAALKQQRTKEYMQEFLESREKWKERERQTMEDENRKIQDYFRLQQEREDSYCSAKNKREEAMAKVQQALSEDIARKEHEKLEMENILQELRLEEEDNKAWKHEQTEAERRKREKVELQNAYAQDHYLKELKRKADKDEEKLFQMEMRAKQEQDDRIERMKEEQRRLKQLQHKRAQQELLDEKRAQYAAEREREAAERLEQLRLEEEKKMLVEEERKRLLKEHAAKLLGHLPRGVIQGEEDLEMLGPEFTRAYTQHC